nr:protein ALP1-like [Rhipicephalus microplus]
MLSSEQEAALLLALLASSSLAMHKEEEKTSLKQRRRQLRCWVRPALQERANLGQANKLLPLLRDRDVEFYRQYIRMPPRTFDTLLHLVKHHIEKKDTNFRKAISPEHRLAQTLRFLAAGKTLRCSSFNFLNGRSTACYIVSTVCQVLWDVLGPIYVARPSSAGEWLQIAKEFEESWNMPHCVGAIDGKHTKSGSEDYNYKHFFSKSMLAVSDACYRFIYVEIGHHGSNSDGGVFSESQLPHIIFSKNEGFPPDAPLGNIGRIPFYLVGDEAFPLKTYLMRPYPRKVKLLL